jgi:spoIIIJ-associated protein
MKTTDIHAILVELLAALPVRVDSVEILEAEGKAPVFVIKTPDASLLIGSRGSHFQALSLLAKRIVAAKAEAQGFTEPRFFIDVNDYRAGITKELITKANILAERARSLRADVEMEPLSAYERLIVHEHLASAPNVKTESVGEGRGRRIVIRFVEDSASSGPEF